MGKCGFTQSRLRPSLWVMKTLLTFGDSNTHGTMPMTARSDSGRFGIGERWPTVCAAALGDEWHLIEEGLPGRTACPYPDTIMGPHMSGQLGLQIALASHKPIDVLTIMLGTNDAKAQFGLTAQQITGHVAALVAMATHPDMQTLHDGFEVLVIAPPTLVEGGSLGDLLYRSAEVSAAFGQLYAQMAAFTGVRFLDAGGLIASSPVDGVHYDAAAHQVLGNAVAEAIAAF